MTTSPIRTRLVARKMPAPAWAARCTAILGHSVASLTERQVNALVSLRDAGFSPEEALTREGLA